MKDIVKAVMDGSKCSESDAREYIESELDNLCDYAQAGDLRPGDIEDACHNIGIDSDYEEYFINRMADRGCQPRMSCMPSMASLEAMMGCGW